MDLIQSVPSLELQSFIFYISVFVDYKHDDIFSSTGYRTL